MEYSTSTAILHPSRRAKTVRSGGRQHAAADGSYQQDLRLLGRFDTFRGRRALVGRAARLPLNLPVCHPENLLDPRAWAYTGDDIRGLHYHDALREEAHSNLTYRAFTLRLGKDVEKLARAQHKHCLDFLRKRIARHLKDALQPRNGVHWLWWFAIEEDDKGALHIHGEIAFFECDRRLVRKALCAAGGKWLAPPPVIVGGKKRQSPRQLRFSRYAPDHGWAGYSLKNTRKAGRGWRRLCKRQGNPRFMTATFEGKAVAASGPVKAAAVLIHKRAVADVKSFRRSHKSTLTA